MVKKKANVVQLNSDTQKADSYLNAALSTLRRWVGGMVNQSPDGARDFNALYGYPSNPDFSFYYWLYRRGGIANTVVAKVAKACWRDIPKAMVGEKEVLKNEIGQLKELGFFNALERADILNRVGKYSVLVVGVPDGDKLDQPLGKARSFDGLYFTPYGEDGIEIVDWDIDPASPRYDMPVMYQLQTVDRDGSTKTGSYKARNVHFSRVIHLAEGALDNQIEGASALEAPLNALLDKDKLRGASAEAFFRNARQKYALEVADGAKLDNTPAGLAAIREEVDAFTNEQQDFLRLKGMSMNVVQPGLFSPRDTFDICVEEVAGITGIPIRILTGKGGGQLAGSEDRASWNGLVGDRQSSECTGYLMRGLRVLEEAGLIKIPVNTVIEWPAQTALSETEQSEVLGRRAKAMGDIAAALRNMDDVADTDTVLASVGLEEIKIDGPLLTPSDEKL